MPFTRLPAPAQQNVPFSALLGTLPMNANISSYVTKLVLFAMASVATALAATPNPAAEPLLQKSNLQYIGSFNVPQLSGMSDHKFVGSTFEYGGGGITYDPANHSLFLVGDRQENLAAEISIPTPVNSTNLSSLPTASMIQSFTDPLEGRIQQINPTDPNAKYIGGMLVDGTNLIVTAYSYYDGNITQSSSHFVRPLNLSATGQVQGPFRVGTLYPGYVAGYMTWIPAQWQTLLGGPALTGNCCVPGASWESQGPAASVFDPAKLGATNPAPATPLVGYPIAHALGTWNTQSTLFNDTARVTGVVFAPGSRSVLFFGHLGIGPFCYGIGTADSTQASTKGYCYDPAETGQKGTHAYPYVYQVWAYDANNFVSVKNGTLQQYQVKPYATWTFNLPFENKQGPHHLGGAAFDSSTDTIYISEEKDGPKANPVIDVFHINLILPKPPTNVSAQ